MNNRQIIITSVGIAVIIAVLVWWVKEQEIKENNKLLDEKDKRIQDLEVNNLHLIQELIKSSTSLPDIVKEQLIDLIYNYEIKNPKVAKELESVIRLVEAEEYEKAVMSITKIIEVILKDKLAKRQEFKIKLTKSDGKKRTAVFADYIEHAKEIRLFTKSEYNFALALKEYRNQEAHELAVKRELNYNMSSMLTGIELIVKCDSFQLN